MCHQQTYTIKNVVEEFLQKKNDTRQKCESIQKNEEHLNEKICGIMYIFLFLKVFERKLFKVKIIIIYYEFVTYTEVKCMTTFGQRMG